MTKSGSWRKGGEIRKVYNVCDLLDEDWRDRIFAIEKMTKNLPYPTRFSVDGSIVVRSMRAAPKSKIGIDPSSGGQVGQLLDQVDRAHSLNLVHGDLHRKNIFWDGKNVVIADFEPSLRQMLGHRSALMATRPFVHPQDLRAGRLSRLTDLMCVFRLIMGLNSTTSAEMASVAAGKRSAWQAVGIASRNSNIRSGATVGMPFSSKEGVQT